MKNFFGEFKTFIARGNVIDLAVGVIIGAAFQKIISSLVNDVIFPALSPLLNTASVSVWMLGPVHIGSFLQAVVDFIIVAFCIFLLVKFINKFKKKEEEKQENMSKEVELLTEIRNLLQK